MVVGPAGGRSLPSHRMTARRVFTSSRSSGRRGWTDRMLSVVITIELLTLLIGGALVVAQPLWSPVDELGHYGYVEQLAEHHSLPVLGQTLMPEPVLAIAHGASPSAYYVDPRTQGLYGFNYEAFQPPLYYIMATPLFAIVPDYVQKAYALRAFDLALLLVTAALGLRLCIDLLGRRWRYGYVMLLAALILPGLVVRSVAISNAALALPIAMCFLIVALRAVRAPSRGGVLIAGVLLGAGLLTELQLVALAPLFLIAIWRLWLRQETLSDRAVILGLTAVPAVLLAPWLAFNLMHFHALTAQAVALQMQNPIINPAHVHYSVRTLPDLTINFLWDVLLPQEWYVFTIPTHPIWQWLDAGTKFVLIPLLLMAVVAAWRRLVRHRAAMLAIPYIGTTAILWWITFGTQWNVMLSRYTYWALPSWALLGAVALLWAGGRRLLVVIESTLASVLVLSWMALARDFLFR